jgi:hypothetical protein
MASAKQRTDIVAVRDARIHGRATLGGVAVETRLAGESEMDAHRRRLYGQPAFGTIR